MKVQQKKRKRSEENDTPGLNHENKKEESPNFLLKLYTILETPEYQNIIHWSDNGKYFIVQNLHDFTENILNKYYKHNNYSSFVRQLNMYDFHKKRSNQNEHIFQHKLFTKGQKDLIPTIKRKNRKEFHQIAGDLAFPDLNAQNNKNNEQALIEYFNNDVPKKVTKNSLEKALNYLIKSVNENSDKQKDLEEKVEKLGKQNEDFLMQNQQMLQEIMSKTEYNKKLEAVVCFILEMIMKKPSLKSGGDLKNVLISKELNSETNKAPPLESESTQIIPLHDIIQTKLNCQLEKPPLSPKNVSNDPFKAFIDKYVERTSGTNPIISPKNDPRKVNIPMLAAGNNDITSLSLSPIRSRKGSFENGMLNDDLFRNGSVPQITNNRDLIKKDNSIDATQNYNLNNLNASFNSEISSVPKNVFDIEFDGNNGEGNENENNISIQSDKKYIDRCFFDDDVSHI